MSQPLRYHVDVGGAVRPIRAIRGSETLSSPWRFEVELHLEPSDALDPDDVVGGDSAILLEREEPLRRIAGVVTRAARFATRSGEAGGGLLRLVIEPRLARARWRVDVRVFREKNAPAIVTEVLAAHGVPIRTKLAGSYQARPYCVQWRETDLDFVSRLLEDEGIFFVVADDGSVILGDHAGAYADGPGALPFRGASTLDAQGDAVFEAGWAGRATAGSVTLGDFNPERPSLDMTAHSADRSGPEWYDYPGEYGEPGEGAAKARLRTEALACQRRRFAGRTSCGRLRPGDRFSLHEAPPSVADGEYAVIRVEHAWTRSDEGFSMSFEALPANCVFRPALATPVPVLPNSLTGFVTGPAGVDVHTDATGSVKVHFPWDRLQPKDDSCSHWIPVLQDDTGRSSAVPRTGWEVLCHFLEGDPDRPVVLGRVYNAADPFTEDLPLRKMRTALQSLTSPRRKDGPSGFNMIRFDDLAGAECIDVHAERDQTVVVEHDQKEQIDQSELRVVKGNEVATVALDQLIHTGADHSAKVDGNQTVTIGGNRRATVAHTYGDSVAGNHALSIGGGHTRIMAKDDTVNVKRNLRETVGGVVVEGAVKDDTVSASRRSLLAAGGAIVEIARVAKAESSNLGRAETVGGLVFSKAGEAMATRAGKSRMTVVGGMFSLSAAKEVLLSGLKKLTAKALVAELKSPSITLKVGETSVILKDGLITMKAKKEIVITGEEENKQLTETADQI